MPDSNTNSDASVAKKSQSSGIPTISFKEKRQLYKAYMPFIKNGGLFIPTRRPYKMGEEVFMLLILMQEKARLPLAGTVVWKSPDGCDGNRSVGIGIQLSSKDGGKVKSKIETYLAGASESLRSTHTM